MKRDTSLLHAHIVRANAEFFRAHGFNTAAANADRIAASLEDRGYEAKEKK